MKKIFLLSLISALYLGCDGTTEINIGPFKPVSNVDDIIMLGSSSRFVAFNYKTKQVEETYDFSKTITNNFAFASGHLIVSLRAGDRINIDVATGKVSEHNLPIPLSVGPFSQTFYNNDDKGFLEVVKIIQNNDGATPGSVIYKYDVVENKMANIINLPLIINFPYSLEQDGVTYWFATNLDENNRYQNYIVNSAGKSLEIGEKLSYYNSFYYAENNFLAHTQNTNGLSDGRESEKTLEKIETLIPLKTKVFFTFPKDYEGEIKHTMMYGDKVLVFTKSELYLLDNAGNILFRWGNYSNESSYLKAHKSFYASSTNKIYKDKLYAYGLVHNSRDEYNVNTHCCVEIDLVTGADNWIEVFEN